MENTLGLFQRCFSYELRKLLAKIQNHKITWMMMQHQTKDSVKQ
jgi:hypothetical protein